jgi:hypothetical protein
MRLLTFTNLYPSADCPRHGIFVAERLRQLVATGEVTAEVVALRPTSAAFFSRSTARPAAPAEARGPVPVYYTRVPKLPGATNWLDPWLWASSASRTVEQLVGRGSMPILDGHFLYAWGVWGDFAGGFWGVHGFSVDQEGNFYVAEVDSGRVQKFRPRQGVNPGFLVGKPVYAAWK